MLKQVQHDDFAFIPIFNIQDLRLEVDMPYEVVQKPVCF